LIFGWGWDENITLDIYVGVDKYRIVDIWVGVDEYRTRSRGK
jgi:hypothetical protein